MEGALVNAPLQIAIRTNVGSFELNAEIDGGKEIIVLFGPSGSGKSTLLNCIAGLQKVTEGEIRIGEKLFLSTSQNLNLPPQIRRCGYLPQNPSLFPHLNVAQNICYAISKTDKVTQQSRLQELLATFHLEGYEKSRVSELSGGQAKRVALARALAAPPAILLLDEPFSALDEELREELAAEIKTIQRQLSIPVVLVTHSKQEALFVADKIVLLQRGKTVKQGIPEEILAKKELSESSQYSW